MRLTKRCLAILQLVWCSGWLSTSQIQRRFFPNRTADAVRRWLRKAISAHLLRAYRRDRMTEAFFALGPEGKRVLENSGLDGIVLERRPPAQLEHTKGINDFRIAAELSLPLAYFFAAWELGGVSWRHSLIPDAIFSTGGRTFSVEFDRGAETLRFFLRTKVAIYREGLPGFPLAAVLVVADREARMHALMRAIADDREIFWFTTIERVRQHALTSPIFFRATDSKEENLF